jgi:Gpi18-like mannosyltransferase
MKIRFIVLLFIGIIIRFLFVGNPGFIADISFWKSWSLAAIDHGIVWTTHNTNINYPPGFIYVLYLMGKMYSIFADPHDYNVFWRENNFLFLFVSKSFAMTADIMISCLIFWFFRQKEKLKHLGINFKPHLPLLLSAVFLLNPIVIIDSALWGQVESFGLLFTLSAIILIFYKRPSLASAIFAIGVFMKLQNIIFIPIMFLFIFRYFNTKTLIKSLFSFIGMVTLINLPFILERDMNQVLYLMTVNSDYFPYLSLNAHNLWWIVASGNGMQVVDKITVLGIINAKTLGLLIFSSCYLLSMLLTFFRPTPRNFLLSLTTAIFAFFLFTTESHERYSYPVIVLLLLFYPFIQKSLINSKHFPKIKNQKLNISLSLIMFGIKFFSKFGFRYSDIYFWLIYGLLTLSIFYNIHAGLVINYPHNGLPIFTELTTKPLGIINSYILTALFFLLLPFVFQQLHLLFLPLILSGLVCLLVVMNFSYLFKDRISLTSFKPIIANQEFSIMQTDKTVNSYDGWKSWNRLSNNYFYYRHGFGSHANSNLVFDIDKKFRKFTSDIGVDTEAGTQASVAYAVVGDGKTLYSSPKMGRFDFPIHIEVDVTNVKYLGLNITDGGDGINNDHADWLNPILYK